MRMLWITAWRNLWRNKRRTIILASAIAVGLSGVLLSMAWVNAWLDDTVKNSVSTIVGQVQIQAPGYYENPQTLFNLPEDAALLAALTQIPNATGVAARVRGQVLLSNAEKGEMGELVGVDPLREPRVSLVPGSLTSGRWLQPDDVGKIVVGEEFLRRFQTRLGRRVIVRGTTLHGDVADAAFVIVGAYTTGLAQFDRRTAYITLGDAQRLFDMTGRVTEYVLAGPSPHQSDVLKAAVSAVAAAPERVITTWQEQLPLILKMMELAGGFMWYFYAFFFIAMAFGIANSFLMAVHERRREIGMMLALGVRRRTVVGILFFEALALAIVGSLLGNAMSLALTSYFGTFGLNLTRWAEGMNEFGMSGIVYPYLRLDNLARATLATTITSVLVVLYPARKASRVRPVEALRSV